jgi:hypothetical protein
MDLQGHLHPKAPGPPSDSDAREGAADNTRVLVSFRFAVSHPRGGGRVGVGVLNRVPPRLLYHRRACLPPSP